MKAHEKIKQARVDLGLKQSDFADVLGISQRDVSKLERGQKKFIPNAYLEYLVKSGFDLNTLFDDEVPLKMLENDAILLREHEAAYHVKADQRMINQIKRLFKIQDMDHLNEYLIQLNEKKLNLTKIIDGHLNSFGTIQDVIANEVENRIRPMLKGLEALQAQTALAVDNLTDIVEKKKEKL